MNKIKNLIYFFSLLLSSFLLLGCGSTPPVLESICDITNDICTYATELCTILPSDTVSANYNPRDKTILASVKNQLSDLQLNAKLQKGKFSPAEVTQYKIDLWQLRNELQVLLLDAKQYKSP
jgi:hypothetical protein